MQQRAEFHALRFRNRAFQAGNLAFFGVLFGYQIEQLQNRHRARIDRNRMAAQRGLHRERHRAARGAVEILEPLDGRAEVFLLRVFQIEIEAGLEHRMQHALDPVRRRTRVGQARHHLGELRNRRHADLVPIEKRMHQRREGLFGRFVTGIFQTTGEQQMLHHRPARVRRHRLVVLLENLMQLAELCRAADCGHGGFLVLGLGA